jgi:amidase
MIRRFAVAVLALAAQGLPAAAQGLSPYASAGEQQAAMTDGKVTSEQLVAAYLQRIERIDRAGPKLNAVIALNRHALADARKLDAERRAGNVRGPLHGVPILLKDNIESADDTPTTAGSLALAANVPQREAPIVKRLTDAGAVILGKANLSEWANFRSTRSISGWSAVGGLVRNPYGLDRTACGSSAGSGAAVAAGLAAVAIGTETDGSVTCPAAINGVVGLKPTVGPGLAQPHRADLARAGHRRADDPHRRRRRALLGVIAGSDPDDPATEGRRRAQGRLPRRPRPRRAERRADRRLGGQQGPLAPGRRVVRGGAEGAARPGRRPDRRQATEDATLNRIGTLEATACAPSSRPRSTPTWPPPRKP